MGNQHGKQRGQYGRYIDWERAEKPTPPGKPCLAPDTSDIPDLIKIQWSPPTSDGGAPIIGYLVEHRRTGSPHWLRASPHLAEDTCLVLSGLEPGWRYQFRVSAENDIGRSDPSEVSEPLTVLLQRSAACAPHFNQELQDIVALENETVELKVHILGTPAPQVSWFKDGFELFSNRRSKIVTENETSSLIIYQAAVEDEGEIKCTATNRAGHAVTKSYLRLQAPPRIRLPRQYEDGLIFERGEVLRLKIASAGRPPPEIIWFHNGEQLVTSGRVEVMNIEHGSSVRIRDACRDDRGEYTVRGVNYIGEDVVSFLVTITDRPSAPGRPQVTMALGKTVTLTWAAPEEDGGCRIGAYIVEYFRLGWDMWLKAATSRLLTAQLTDLIEGSQYKFRVKAENPYGVSDPSDESDVVFVPDAKRGVLTPPPTQSHQAWLVAVEEDSRKRQVSTDLETDAAKRRRRLEENARRLLDGEVSRTSDDEEMTELEDSAAARRRLLDENARRLLDTPLDVLLSSARPPGPVEKPPRRRRDSRSPSVSPGRTDDTPPVPKRRSKQKTQEGVPSLALPVSPARVPGDGIPAASITHGTPMGSSGRTLPGLSAGPDFSPPPVRSPRLSPPMSPALLRDDSITHGSSELMLVLYPDDPKPRGMPLTLQHRSEVELRLLEPAIAPPLSLSSPELGSDEPYEMPLMRNAVSSTELLHERAMARLYQDAAEEELLKMQMRRKSLERRPSLRETGVERRSSFKESALERRSSFKETIERKHSFKEDVDSFKEEALRAVPAKVEEVKTKKLSRMSSEEKEQMEFAKIRERLRLKNEASVKAPEPRVRPANLKQESSMSSQLSSFNGDTGSEFYDGEVEDVSGEEEDYGEDEEMGEEEEDELVEEFMQRLREEVKDSKALKDRKSPVASTPPAVPVHGILKKGSRFEAEERKKNEEDTYHPRSMVPTHSEIKEIPVAVPPQNLPLPTITLNDDPEDKPERSEKSKQDEADEALVIEQPAPPSPLPAKRKSKLFSKIGFGRKKKAVEILVTDSVPPTTSIVLPKPILKKKSLKKREKKDKTSNESASPSPDRTAEKKQVRIAEPGSGGLGVPTTDDPKVSPLTKKRNELKQRRQQSIEEEEEANKIIINHYSDIVKEYGGPKRQPPKLYLDLEELEAHAPDVPVPEEIPDVPEMAVGGSDQEERGSAPDISEVDAELRSLLDVAEFVEPPDYEEPQQEQELNLAVEPELEQVPEPEVPEEEQLPEGRPHSPSPTSSHSSNAEEVVRETFDYLVDVAIVLFAFWLYFFKSEIYVIPVLVLLVYRQLQQTAAKKFRAAKRAISNKMPKLTGNKSPKEDDDKKD